MIDILTYLILTPKQSVRQTIMPLNNPQITLLYKHIPTEITSAPKTLTQDSQVNKYLFYNFLTSTSAAHNTSSDLLLESVCPCSLNFMSSSRTQTKHPYL